MKTKAKKIDIFSDITNKVIDLLKQGVAPWKKSWKSSGLAGFCGAGAPRNYKTKKAYSGVNIMLLIMAGFESPWWMTFKQAQSMGGRVIKGEKGTTAVRWVVSYFDIDGNWINPKLVKKRSDYHRKTMFPSYFHVFNEAQIEGLEFPVIKEPETIGPVEVTHNPIENADNIIDAFEDPPILKLDGRNPCYNPRTDTVHLPVLDKFSTPEQYYKTLFHEFAHSTGAEKRLNRKGIADFDKFGSEQYAKEELIAELSSCFMSEIAGFQNEETLEDTASYCKGWIKKLQDDPKMIVHAMSGAQKATEHILGGPLAPEMAEVNEEQAATA
jgi:antirestriction protein ArdC|tara:strand:- start:75 stop:1052 length:978 start_codon:yes stop_codon:yes gene_type:complete